MALIAYMDESGDHSMTNVDPGSPNFCLTLAVFDAERYATSVVPAFIAFKHKYFGHEGVVLHSHEIRKQIGDFGILRNRDVRESFMEDLTALMRDSDYQLISIVIDKPGLVNRYVRPDDPYELSLGLALERLSDWAVMAGADRCPIIAEARGKRENNALAAEHLRILQHGNNVVPARLFAGLKLPLEFVHKERNLIGHQIADLAAYTASKWFSPNKGDPRPFQAIKHRYFRGGPSSFYSLKCFP